MLGGLGNKLSEAIVASAATIKAEAEVIKLTGSTQVNTITPPPNGGFCTMIVIIPTAGTIVFGTSGNILIGATAPQNRPTFFVYSKLTAKWHIGAIS